MDTLIQALGLDWKILIAQLVNFAVLVFVLWRFAYKPVFEMLAERRSKIKKGLDDAHQAELRLQDSINEGKTIVSQSRQEANEIMTETQSKAEKRYQEIVDSAQTEIKKQTTQGLERIEAKKLEIAKEVKKELSQLLSLGLEKILREDMDEKKDQKLINQTLEDLS